MLKSMKIVSISILLLLSTQGCMSALTVAGQTKIDRTETVTKQLDSKTHKIEISPVTEGIMIELYESPLCQDTKYGYGKKPAFPDDADWTLGNKYVDSIARVLGFAFIVAEFGTFTIFIDGPLQGVICLHFNDRVIIDQDKVAHACPDSWSQKKVNENVEISLKGFSWRKQTTLSNGIAIIPYSDLPLEIFNSENLSFDAKMNYEGKEIIGSRITNGKKLSYYVYDMKSRGSPAAGPYPIVTYSWEKNMVKAGDTAKLKIRVENKGKGELYRFVAIAQSHASFVDG